MDMKARATGRYEKPSKSWIVSRLKTLVQLRGGSPDGQVIAAMASGLSGFSEAAIDKACTVLERNMGEYESRMPPLAMILDACRASLNEKQAESGPVGLYRCERCKASYAAYRTPVGGCQGCGYGVLLQTKAPEPEFDHAGYMRDVRAHPERYVKVSDVIREVIAKRRAQGKPVWNFSDPRAGEA